MKFCAEAMFIIPDDLGAHVRNVRRIHPEAPHRHPPSVRDRRNLRPDGLLDHCRRVIISAGYGVRIVSHCIPRFRAGKNPVGKSSTALAAAPRWPPPTGTPPSPPAFWRAALLRRGTAHPPAIVQPRRRYPRRSRRRHHRPRQRQHHPPARRNTPRNRKTTRGQRISITAGTGGDEVTRPGANHRAPSGPYRKQESLRRTPYHSRARTDPSH